MTPGPGADGSERALAFIRVEQAGDALTQGALEPLAGEPLIAFLRGRRWFGDKGGRPAEARVADVIRIPWDGGEFAIARLEVRDEGGGARWYQLPLSLRATEAIANPPPGAVLARVGWTGGGGLLFDAVEDSIFRRHLARAFTTSGGQSFGGERTRWVIEPMVGTAVVAPTDGEIRLGAAEQSNTSIIFGREAILKLFRRLEPGEHADVEITRFLTAHAKFAHTPSLLGTIRFEDPASPRTVAAMLQQYLPGSVDAWSYALDCGTAYFNTPDASGSTNAFASDAERLGVITRELHDALASGGADPAFAPERVTREHIEGWAQRAQHSIRQGLALLERQMGRLSGERVPEARALLRRRDEYLSSVHEIVDALADDAGFRIRIHGDYHLGQVLRTASGDFMIIDFEGEPARSMAERREKTSPLRDVAGMLRSFAYAAATLSLKSRATGTMPSTAVEVRAARWERDARDAFVRGYGRGADELGLLPGDPANAKRLLALFETEKVFYELAYELNSRPDWAWIPMRGVSKLMVR